MWSTKNKKSAQVCETKSDSTQQQLPCKSLQQGKKPTQKISTFRSKHLEMYQLYCDWLVEKHSEDSPDTESYFHHVFSTEFNLGFTSTMSDMCNYCDKFRSKLQNLDKVNDAQQINELNTEHKIHIKRAQMAHTILKNMSKDDPTVVVITIDLQQTLQMPKINTGIQYYKRKLWTYNFGIHNLKTRFASMYLWDESIDKRGSVEICNCLMHYIDSNILPGVKTLHIFSDNCSGQNKNLNMVLTCLL